MKKVLITGMAGFIGFHLSKLLVKNGYKVVGLDSINNYYDVDLKLFRLSKLGFSSEAIEYNALLKSKNISFIKLDLMDLDNMKVLFKNQKFDYVINLAAQAGVRYSLEKPQEYIDSNITGFLNVLECCRAFPVEHLIFASSSSVYGLSKQIPFNVENCTDHPISMYAASKKSNEMMAHSYAHLFGVPSTGLRFFTVYGPLGRPDMALYIFTKAMVEDKEFDVYNYGNMSRDFTYVGDIVESINRLIPLSPSGNSTVFKTDDPIPSASSAPYQLFNIGNNNPVLLLDFISIIEKTLGKKGKMNLKPIQDGDVESTYANVESLFDYINFKPSTPLEDGVKAFVDSYLKFVNK